MTALDAAVAKIEAHQRDPDNADLALADIQARGLPPRTVSAVVQAAGGLKLDSATKKTMAKLRGEFTRTDKELAKCRVTDISLKFRDQTRAVQEAFASGKTIAESMRSKNQIFVDSKIRRKALKQFRGELCKSFADLLRPSLNDLAGRVTALADAERKSEEDGAHKFGVRPTRAVSLVLDNVAGLVKRYAESPALEPGSLGGILPADGGAE